MTDLPRWREEPIGRGHDRRAFDCGDNALNSYLANFAHQNYARDAAKTFVAVPVATPSRVLGFYSLAAGEIAFANAPAVLTRRLLRHPLPIVRLARLAVDRSCQRHGLGGQLLLAAGLRALSVREQAGVVALAIDAKDDRAAAWYERFGAIRLLDAPLSLVLPLAAIEAALVEADRRP